MRKEERVEKGRRIERERRRRKGILQGHKAIVTLNIPGIS